MAGLRKRGGNRTVRSVVLVLFMLFFLLSIIPVDTVCSQNENLVIKVGIYENPPKIYTNDEGIEKGIFPRIIEYIAEQENWEVEYVHGSFFQGLTRLESGEIHMMPDVAWSQERDELYAFNDETVISDWGRLYGRADVEVETFLDLEGKMIAVMEEGIYNVGPGGIRAILANCDVNATFLEYPGYHEVFQALESGEADVGAVNRFFGRRFKKEYGVKMTSIMFTPVSIRFALDRDNPNTVTIIDALDRHLVEMKEDPNSIYYRAIDEYMGETGEIAPREVFPLWARYSILAALASIVFLFGVNIFLKKKVDKQTIDLREDIEKREAVEEELREHRERLEEMVNQRTKDLQDSLEELKTFTYSVSHDLRAPVRAMEGFSGILLQEYAEDMEEPAKDYMVRINAAAKNMDKLITDLLRYGRLTHEEIRVRELPLRQVVDDAVLQFKGELEKTGATVTVAGDFPRVIANDFILKQCILNIIENAVKFVDEGTTPEIEIRSKTLKDSTILEVKDNGIGISEEYHDKIFNVFERLHGGDAYSGTGVGLAVVRKGIERMGGRVGVRSKPGTGSVFWIELPLVEDTV